jgi:transcriptional regulator GlxA family with amidase domain
MSERVFLVVGYDGAELLDIACVTSALDIANRVGADPPYRTVLATLGQRDVTCDSGLRLAAEASLERFNQPIDTLVVIGGLGHERAAASVHLVGHVRRLAALARRVSSACTGATVLAEAGLLTGRRATTHWLYADRLAASYPDVRVDPEPIYVCDGNVTTSGGVTSALDLTLAFIEQDHGVAVARGVAMGTVAYLQRPGGQSQMSMFLTDAAPDDWLVRRTIEHIVGHLGDDLTTGALARRAGVSERHLFRLFLAYVQETPAQYVRRARTEAAAHLLVSTELPLATVARRCGFGSTESLRQAFRDRYAVPPSRYRLEHSAGPTNPAPAHRDPDPAAGATAQRTAGAGRMGS